MNSYHDDLNSLFMSLTSVCKKELLPAAMKGDIENSKLIVDLVEYYVPKKILMDGHHSMKVQEQVIRK